MEDLSPNGKHVYVDFKIAGQTEDGLPLLTIKFPDEYIYGEEIEIKNNIVVPKTYTGVVRKQFIPHEEIYFGQKQVHYSEIPRLHSRRDVFRYFHIINPGGGGGNVIMYKDGTVEIFYGGYGLYCIGFEMGNYTFNKN